MSGAASRIADELAQVEVDLSEVDEQVAAGEIDETTADRLRTTYLAEADRLRVQLASTSAVQAPPQHGRSRRRVLAGGIFLGVGAVAIVIAAVIAVNPRGGNQAGGIVNDVLAGEGVDLSEVTNEEMEQIVADNPTIVPMRMALARRYFEAGAFERALPHYMVILDEQGVEEPEALANVGWMTALSGRADVAEPFLERALAIRPDFAEAHWFMGNVQIALGNTDAARDALQQLLTFDVPDDIRAQAESLLAELAP